ncbi:MAG: hypothetical protein C0411_04795 [Pseudomonas sp.]|nr:hypothetical protein [Pseudomonas sp.]
MGASLLAKVVYQTTSMLTDTPSSRAGSLPQGIPWLLSAAVYGPKTRRKRQFQLHPCRPSCPPPYWGD